LALQSLVFSIEVFVTYLVPEVLLAEIRRSALDLPNIKTVVGLRNLVLPTKA